MIESVVSLLFIVRSFVLLNIFHASLLYVFINPFKPSVIIRPHFEYSASYRPSLPFLPREYARVALGVVILSARPSVCLSVTRVDCDKTE